jgi:hypothetical protein
LDSAEEDKIKAINELQEALKELSLKDELPLREKAMVLEAMEKIKSEQS